ncbi:MAG: hypothetical protein HYZ10_08830 [Ignavibacteriales bacterium]|nr:hypothetical protein [Ignavibacteriales bacterium]
MKWNDLKLIDEKTFNESVRNRDFLFKGYSLLPYQVYLILKNKYDVPVYKQEEWKVQWMYLIEHKNAFFEIYDWKLTSWSMGVYLKDSKVNISEKLAAELSDLLEKDASKYNSICKSKQNNSEEYVIQNPYVIYRETADSILDTLIKNKNLTTESYNNLGDTDLCRSAFLMYLSSVEGFINLIYELYLRKELKEKRIYERLLREQIDLKIKLAPVYCDCFKNKILDSEDDNFKRFHSLANLRNDFVHANFTNSMITPVIYEDNYEFILFKSSETSIGIPNNFSDFEIQHIEDTKEITANLITWIVSSMTSIHKREFMELIDKEFIKIIV